MNDSKYIGLDVHQATISATVLDAEGKLVMEAILETKAETVLQFIHGLRGSLHVTFEEGTSAAWLYTLLKPHAFADRCRHERRVAEDSSAAIRRVWAIPCGGQEVHPRDIFGDRQYLRAIYSPRHRAEWLGKITEASVRRRAELLHRQAKKELLAEGRKHKATKLLRQI